MEKTDANQLLAKYQSGICTDEEKAQLMNWFHQVGDGQEVGLSDEELEQVERNIWLNVQQHTMHKIIKWRRMAAAAAMLLMTLSISFYLYTHQNNQIILTHLKSADEILAGHNKAILTLSNGEKINLDEAANGVLSQQKGIKISKLADGQLSYSIDNAGVGQTDMNTIETQFGGQYQVILPDGTKVWLNAKSSLKYPVQFTGKERKVTLSGEGYFEVAKDKDMPFKVITHNQGITQVTEVLGTRFNINAYQDHTDIKTTLLEGSVKVNRISANHRLNQSKMLKPGQQCLIDQVSMLVQEADIESTVAWKNGYFVFSNEPIIDAMTSISRWYNMEVEYTGYFDDITIVGNISRKHTLHQTLHLLELTGNFKFKIQGRRIVVMK